MRTEAIFQMHYKQNITRIIWSCLISCINCLSLHLPSRLSEEIYTRREFLHSATFEVNAAAGNPHRANPPLNGRCRWFRSLTLALDKKFSIWCTYLKYSTILSLSSCWYSARAAEGAIETQQFTNKSLCTSWAGCTAARRCKSNMNVYFWLNWFSISWFMFFWYFF